MSEGRRITMRDVLAWIEVEGVKPVAEDAHTAEQIARASAAKALADVRALLEHGPGASFSASRGIFGRGER